MKTINFLCDNLETVSIPFTKNVTLAVEDGYLLLAIKKKTENRTYFSDFYGNISADKSNTFSRLIKKDIRNIDVQEDGITVFDINVPYEEENLPVDNEDVISTGGNKYCDLMLNDTSNFEMSWDMREIFGEYVPPASKAVKAAERAVKEAEKTTKTTRGRKKKAVPAEENEASDTDEGLEATEISDADSSSSTDT